MDTEVRKRNPCQASNRHIERAPSSTAIWTEAYFYNNACRSQRRAEPAQRIPPNFSGESGGSLTAKLVIAFGGSALRGLWWIQRGHLMNLSKTIENKVISVLFAFHTDELMPIQRVCWLYKEIFKGWGVMSAMRAFGVYREDYCKRLARSVLKGGEHKVGPSTQLRWLPGFALRRFRCIEWLAVGCLLLCSGIESARAADQGQAYVQCMAEGAAAETAIGPNYRPTLGHRCILLSGGYRCEVLAYGNSTTPHWISCWYAGRGDWFPIEGTCLARPILSGAVSTVSSSLMCDQGCEYGSLDGESSRPTGYVCIAPELELKSGKNNCCIEGGVSAGSS
ncbi:hypothetical protein SAMN06296416_109127 [Pseudoxanthomonas wuyuanensis]|uniref:Uncharacterized protein n=1 Tax=Pseudoxanthomonas wuyuanensis TaxID=1073196 RepID=A0A286DCP2_9GAMM|nr:hypothetical protein SAMN06296416_109127 [Pseudoxanthomonas wuyuanensis]